MKNDINIILDSITKESEQFLENDMGLTLVETKQISDNGLDTHLSLIDLMGDEKYTVLISMDDKLFEVLFNNFFEDDVEDDERDELVDALPLEIANTVTGLAIRNFPLNVDALELGVPFNLEKESIFKVLNEKISKSLKIVTSEGSFICTVIRY